MLARIGILPRFSTICSQASKPSADPLRSFLRSSRRAAKTRRDLSQGGRGWLLTGSSITSSHLQVRFHPRIDNRYPFTSGVQVNSVPQPEHQRRQTLSVDNAYTGISSPTHETRERGRCGALSHLTSERFCPKSMTKSCLQRSCKERATGEGNSLQDRSEAIATNTNNSESFALNGRGSVCSLFVTSKSTLPRLSGLSDSANGKNRRMARANG